MRCATCGGQRLALASLPGREEAEYRVCLTCASFWPVPAEDLRGPTRPAREAAG